MKLRHLHTILLLLVTLICFAGCDSTPEVPPLILLGEGAPVYTVVRGDNADPGDVDGVVLFNKYMKTCGTPFATTTDWDQNPVSDYEIVIGETLRDDTDAAMTISPRDLGPEGWYVKAAGSRIYIGGGTPEMTVAAVEHFLTTFFGYTGDPETPAVPGNVTVPGDYEYLSKQEFALNEITANGVSLRDFRITWEDGVSSTAAKSLAGELQTTLFYGYGIWVDIDAKNEGTGPVIRLRISDDGSFSLASDSNGLQLSADIASFARG